VFNVGNAVVLLGLEVVICSAVFTDVSRHIVAVAELYVSVAGSCSHVVTRFTGLTVIALIDVVSTMRKVWVTLSDS